MTACKWLSIRELILYHSLVTMWKILKFKKPIQIFEKFEMIDENNIKTSIPRLKITDNYWRWRSARNWNNLPLTLKQTNKISTFKN